MKGVTENEGESISPLAYDLLAIWPFFVMYLLIIHFGTILKLCAYVAKDAIRALGEGQWREGRDVAGAGAF